MAPVLLFAAGGLAFASVAATSNALRNGAEYLKLERAGAHPLPSRFSRITPEFQPLAPKGFSAALSYLACALSKRKRWPRSYSNFHDVADFI